MIREIQRDELNELLTLYTHLHELGIPWDSAHLRQTWEQICTDENHHIIVCDVDGKIVSSCVCVIIPNLTRHIRPYAFIENVVTHADHRGKGYATACLNHAKELALRRDLLRVFFTNVTLLFLCNTHKTPTVCFCFRSVFSMNIEM